MKYIDYFSVFLGIEQKLSKYFNQLEYNARTKSIFSYPISLFLLQICPVIESYMVDLCINSNTVQNSDLFSWQYNYMIWQKKREKGSIELKTDKSGKRSISGFPKFSYVIEKCFKISSHTVAFNPNKYFHAYGENICLRSYQSLSKFVDYQDFDINAHRSFPIGLDTPRFWAGYNKIKHDLGIASNRVTYESVIEALSALFVLLSYCEPEIELLQNNGFIDDNYIKTIHFKARIDTNE